MVCLPSCNIDCPIYIWRIESKQWQFYKRYLHLSPHLQIRPCLVHPYLPQPHCWAIKKGSLWNNLAWWPLPAPSIPMPPPILTTSHHHAPLLLALSLIFHFFDDILEIPVFRQNSWDIISFYTWDYSCMGQSQHVFCKKNASWCSVQCTGILLVFLHIIPNTTLTRSLTILQLC